MGTRGAHRRPRTPRRRRFVALRVLLTVTVAWFFVAQPTGASGEVEQVIPRSVRLVAATPARAIALSAVLPVSLTFDDGPNAEFTPRILAVLARYQVRATFFVVGSQVERMPELAKRIVAEGHVLGNHTWSHRNLTEVAAGELTFEIDHTQQVLAGLGGAPVRCFRTPFGRVNRHVRDAVHARGLSLSEWTTDSADWKQPGTQAIVTRALEGAVPGAVLLFHDSGPDMSQTVAALPAIITGVRAKGLSLAPIC